MVIRANNSSRWLFATHKKSILAFSSRGCVSACPFHSRFLHIFLCRRLSECMFFSALMIKWKWTIRRKRKKNINRWLRWILFLLSREITTLSTIRMKFISIEKSKVGCMTAAGTSWCLENRIESNLVNLSLARLFFGRTEKWKWLRILHIVQSSCIYGARICGFHVNF